MQITNEIIKSILPPERKKDSHKGDYGHLLVIAGSLNMTGASVLTAAAALHCGPGLVTLAIPQKTYNVTVSRLPAEVMTLVLPDTQQGSISDKSYSIIMEYIQKRKISALAIGPGMSSNSETIELVREVLISSEIRELPIILDADGLLGFVPRKNMVITPHPGELARLTKKTIREIQSNREKNVVEFAKENEIIAVLKGNNTIITDGEQAYVNQTGNPGMATGGSGDVLTGMIAGFISQVTGNSLLERLFNSCILGVYLHGLSGDLASQEKTQISVLPTDSIAKIPDAIKSAMCIKSVMLTKK